MTNPDYELLRAIATMPGAPRALDTRPLFQDLGAELSGFDPVAGSVDMSFTLSSRHLQGHGVVAGGIVGSMLDIAMSLPVLGVLDAGTPFATANYSVNLLAALKPGRVAARGWIERRSDRVAFCAARLTSANADQRVLATAAGTVLILTARR